MEIDICLRKERNVYSSSYVGYGCVLEAILKAIDPKLEEAYKVMQSGLDMNDLRFKTADETLRAGIEEKWPGVALLVCHSDCDGWFGSPEAKKIYDDLKKIEVKPENGNPASERYNKLREAFRLCSEDPETVLVYI
jgi:hypothetical protein